MTWILFVLFGGDYTDRLRRWEFRSKAACEEVREFVSQQDIRAICVVDKGEKP